MEPGQARTTPSSGTSASLPALLLTSERPPLTANSLSSASVAVSALGPTGAVQRAFLNLKEAAEYLGLSPNTLYVWRHRRQGPPSFRMGAGGRVMYRLEALDAWVREQELADSRSNTSLNPVDAAPTLRPSRTTRT
ncbi:helix-turn-helix transcriptional regulator [Streptomyces sp. CB02923]|uniref:helix-turn-helix transcriptional regulator n=1 Tax=Streptomyces sp. CB02923 TaxID=1718985 RepID=UPI0009A0F14C|nr:helix-turn-helix domain-containing protein [Streptomyces sp. CB02923]